MDSLQVIVHQTDGYAIIDEKAYYHEVYAGTSYAVNPDLYEIRSPFRMDSEIASLVRNSCPENRRKRKRRRTSASNMPSDWLKLCRLMESCYEEIRSLETRFFEQTSGQTVESNNLTARNLAKKAGETLFSSVGWYIAEEGESSLGSYSFKRENNFVQSVPSECTLWQNDHSQPVTLTLSGEEFIIPSKSSFILGDARLSRHLLARGLAFDCIIMDPPWSNKSARRKSAYAMFEESELLDLRVSDLLMDEGIVIIWVTSNARVRSFVTDFLLHHGLRKLAIWHWLKITRLGECVCEFRPEHKVPFESFVLACKESSEHAPSKFKDNFVLASTPCAVHSRKPPIAPILKLLGVFDSEQCLEVFGRYLLPDTVTIGFEAVKLQNLRYFVNTLEERKG